MAGRLWDSSHLNTCQPDDQVSLTLSVFVNPDSPTGAAVLLCAADLPISVTISRGEEQIPDLAHYVFVFVGKAMDISVLDMYINEWTDKYAVRRGVPQKEGTYGGSTEDAPEGDSGESG